MIFSPEDSVVRMWAILFQGYSTVHILFAEKMIGKELLQMPHLFFPVQIDYGVQIHIQSAYTLLFAFCSGN